MTVYNRTMRTALTVAYDGRDFDGWQTQPSGNTIQDHLESALTKMADQRVSTICAGRTDAGVHAMGQVVHFDSDANRPLSAWVRGVNSHLPDAIAVLSAQFVREDFHARFDAQERCYRYYLCSTAVRNPLSIGRTGWVHRELDLERMRQAAQVLVGKHDFSSFRSAQCQAATPVREMNAITITGSSRSLCIRFSANAYLQHMIRNIVGLLIMIGDGRQPIDWAASVLQSRDRASSAPTFSAEGLYFESVRYPDADKIKPTPISNPYSA